MRLKNAFLLMAFLFVSLFAASDSLTSYYFNAAQAYPSVIAQQAPYNYVANVDLSSTNWTAPAGVTIMLIKAGDSGVINCKTWTDSALLYIGQRDIEPVCARKIYKSGTTATRIVVYGKR